MSNEIIGDYVIVSELGQGALGTVFLAEHRFLKQTFALKILSKELTSDRSFIDRLEKGSSFLTTLNHPHIVKIHNLSFANGVYFLVSDPILNEEGERQNLADYLAQHPFMKEEELLEIVSQIASALDYGHQKMIAQEEPLIHQRLKLSNILVDKEKERIKVYLSDFGLSRILSPFETLDTVYKSITQLLSRSEKNLSNRSKFFPSSLDHSKNSPIHLAFFNHYAFLAPEQKEFGSSQKKIDARTDHYAFGVLVYYLLMHEFPEGYFEMPSNRHPEFKLNWDTLLFHCLQSDLNKRPGFLGKLVEELQLSGNSKKISSLKPILKPQEFSKPEYEADPGAIFQSESQIVRYQPKQTDGKVIEPILTDMIIIEGKTFFRGSSHGGRDEMPRHGIELFSFAIDVHAVTNEQFVRFLEMMGGEKDAHNNDIIRLKDSRIKRSGGMLSIESGYAKHPVVGVTWYGAFVYAKWVGKRLPTEAEWEVAACGGLENSIYPTGNTIERSQANFFSSDTIAVMSYPSNEYGLYDMAGNVYEWCYDWYGYQYYELSVQEPRNPKGPAQGVYRVLRGGCWKSLKDDLRCAHRHRNNPGTANGTYGFRCAADVEVYTQTD